MSRSRRMIAGTRLGNAVDNYGDKKNGGASTVGNVVFTNNALGARSHPWIYHPKGGLRIGGAGIMTSLSARISGDGIGDINQTKNISFLEMIEALGYDNDLMANSADGWNVFSMSYEEYINAPKVQLGGSNGAPVFDLIQIDDVQNTSTHNSGNPGTIYLQPLSIKRDYNNNADQSIYYDDNNVKMIALIALLDITWLQLNNSDQSATFLRSEDIYNEVRTSQSSLITQAKSDGYSTILFNYPGTERTISITLKALSDSLVDIGGVTLNKENYVGWGSVIIPLADWNDSNYTSLGYISMFAYNGDLYKSRIKQITGTSTKIAFVPVAFNLKDSNTYENSSIITNQVPNDDTHIYLVLYDVTQDTQGNYIPDVTTRFIPSTMSASDADTALQPLYGDLLTTTNTYWFEQKPNQGSNYYKYYSTLETHNGLHHEGLTCSPTGGSLLSMWLYAFYNNYQLLQLGSFNLKVVKIDVSYTDSKGRNSTKNVTLVPVEFSTDPTTNKTTTTIQSDDITGPSGATGSTSSLFTRAPQKSLTPSSTEYQTEWISLIALEEISEAGFTLWTTNKISQKEVTLRQQSLKTALTNRGIVWMMHYNKN